MEPVGLGNTRIAKDREGIHFIPKIFNCHMAQVQIVTTLANAKRKSSSRGLLSYKVEGP
jgi:hypothetical protein